MSTNREQPESRRFSTLLVVLAAILALIIGALLALVKLAGSSAGGTLSTGRAVTTYSDSVRVRSSFSADTATIKTGGKTIVVAPARLLVDGAVVARIDRSVSQVDVHVRRGAVSFVADGKPVKTTFAPPVN